MSLSFVDIFCNDELQLNVMNDKNIFVFIFVREFI